MASAAIAAVALTTGCNKIFERESVSNEPGSIMVFGASGGWQKDPGTRTEYSGKDERGRDIDGDSEWERIDWVEGKDRIRILCDAAVGKANPSDKKADYIISGKQTGDDKKKSLATIDPADGNSLHWGTNTHYIYALYPAPATESNYNFNTNKTVPAANSQIVSVAGNKAKITGVIPAVQEVVKVGDIFKPNMNYAYMYAAAKATPGVPGAVTLSFQPLVTALEISLKAFDNVMAGKDLVSLTLATPPTTGSYLSGSFEAELDCDNTTTPFTVTPTNTVAPGREITVTFPNATRLSTTDYSVVTVLALGLTHTNLTLTLTFSGNYTRTLALNTKVNNVSTPVSIGAGRKGYIKLGVPSDSYVLGTLSPVTVAYSGSSSASLGSGFVSYRQQGSHTVPVKFKLEYSEANANGTCAGVWTYTPDWVDDTGISYTGSVNGQNLPVTIAHSPEVHTKRLYDATPEVDFDLSTWNVARGEPCNSTTANCYVVKASGTYKFPVVYGNCMQNGSTASNNPRYAHAPHDAGVEGVDPNDSDGKGYFLGRFLDHLNSGIGGAYIGYLYQDKPMAAALLWTDVDGLIESVQYNAVQSNRNNDYISFTVPRATIRQGNALIAVTVNGVIAWSWHIWVTDADLSHPIAGPTATYANDPNPKAYEFAPVNLGWCDKEAYEERKCYVRAVQVDENGNTFTGGLVSEPVLITQEPSAPSYGGNNPYYQWGRKDPLEATSGNGNQSKQYYGTHQPSFAAVSSVNTLGYAIQHPNVFYYENDPRVYSSWCADYHYYNLWNYNVVTRGLSSDAVWTPVGKTIYDPCPVGYSVPPVTAFTGLYIDASNVNFPLDTDTDGNKVRIYNNTLWFPNIGTVGSSHVNVGSQTRYWSASPDSPGNEYRGLTLRFTNDAVAARANNLRSAGFPIRPVRRDATDSVQ